MMMVFASLLAAASVASAAYWMGDIAHQGRASFNPDKNYTVFRNVREFGAKGDGVTDDSTAINAAISSGGRCGGDTPCVGSTTTPAVVYFPSGTYLISQPIISYYYTQIIGDPTDMPTIQGAPSFPNNSLGLIDADPYGSTGKLRYGSTNVFFRQIRNIIVDTTAISGRAYGIHWPSSQATSIQNCVFRLSSGPEDEHTGIFMEEGSGGFLTDLVFYGGKFGAQFGNQQYTTRNLTFHGCDTGILQLWNWGWTYKSIAMYDTRVGINASGAAIGSMTLLDSEFVNVTTAFIGSHAAGARADDPGRGSIILENISLSQVGTAVLGPNGTLVGGTTANVSHIPSYAYGNTYVSNGPERLSRVGTVPYFPRPGPLVLGDKFYERSKPQYEHVPVGSFLSARSFGAVGDGLTDDTEALNGLFQAAASMYKDGRIAFLDAGYYRVTDTVLIPPNVRIVGEALASVILGAGMRFSDIGSPRPVVRVGSAGSSGYVELSDFIVSTQGATAGAVLIEYNLVTPPGTSCSVARPSGLWDVHVRIGGFAGSDLQAAQCAARPNATDPIDPKCIAAYMSMHITPAAGNIYMENSWLWVADHDIEDANNTQISVFAGRGLNIESAMGRIWLVGTAVEHHTLYQYQLVDTRDVWMGQIQTETPYYQPNPPAPGPFVRVNAAIHDPDFSIDCRAAAYSNSTGARPNSTTSGGTGTYSNTTLAPSGSPPCAMAWGLRVLGSTDIVVFGAGLYSFFNDYSTNCSSFTSGESCQARIAWFGPSLDGKKAASDTKMDIALYNLNTIGAVNMVTTNGVDAAGWKENFATFASTVALFWF